MAHKQYPNTLQTPFQPDQSADSGTRYPRSARTPTSQALYDEPDTSPHS